MLLLLLLASPPLPQAVEAWRPMLALGDEPRVLESSVAKTARLNALTRSAYLSRRLDAPTRALMDEAATNLSTLDPSGLYALIGRRGNKEGDRHSFSVWGAMHPLGHYAVSSRGAPPPPTFSVMSGEVAIVPTKPKRYLVTTDFGVHLDLNAKDVIGFWSSVADWLDGAGGDKPARRGEDEADAAVLARLGRSFPDVGAFVTRYFTSKDVVAASKDGLWIYLRPRFDAAAFAKDYPAMAGMFADRGDGSGPGGMRARMRLLDDRDKSHAVFRMDSRTPGTVAALSSGVMRLVPGAYGVNVDFELDFAGVEMGLTNLDLDLDVARDGSLEIVYRLDEMPKITVEGAVLSVLPVEVIDALIPSQVETIIRDFYTALVEGDDGNGASYRFFVPADRSDAVRIQTRFEMLDNGFVSFWLRAGSDMAEDDPLARKDLQRLLDTMLKAFESDFARFQAEALP